jgi:integrative and conjugative element protein (TIGR02256 family)
MSRRIVWLDERALALIESETRKRPRTETGGALFGFGDGDDLVVAGAYGPGPRARHRRTTFEPHPETTGLLMETVREHSRRRYRYLGSWHSHPGGVPRPSGTDIATVEAVAEEAEVALAQPLMLIQASRPIGREAQPVALRAWRWSSEFEWVFPWTLEQMRIEERHCPVVPIPAGWGRGEHLLSPDPS